MLYKVSCQRENKAQHCGWNTSVALYTMRSHLKDWHAGPGTTTDIKADKIISMKWLIVFQSKYHCECCGWHCSGCSSSRVTFSFRPPPLLSRCQSSSWPTRKRMWRWTSVSTWRPASGLPALSKITSRWDAAQFKNGFETWDLPEVFGYWARTQETHNVNLEKGDRSPALIMTGFK